MFKNFLFTITALSVLLFTTAVPVGAVSELTAPNFPSCTSPSGTLKVSYASGTHGIVGNGEFTGSDSVYIVGDSNLTQCFCATNGSGIQTNWWKVGSLSEKQIKTLADQGWTYIPSGSPWGLDESAYMARNLDYSCGSNSTPTSSGNGGNGSSGTSAASAPVCDSAKPAAPQLLSVFRQGSSATVTWTKVDQATHYTIYYGTDPKNYSYSVPNTGNVTTFTINGLNANVSYSFEVRAVNNCMPSDPSGAPQVLGASTEQVLGLAATGNMLEITVLLVLSAVSLLLSVLARKYGRAK